MLWECDDEIEFLFLDDEEECGEECDNMLAELENIDDECDAYGVDMVKVVDGDTAAEYGVMSTPALVYFRRGTILSYEGDLMDTAAILGWLTSNEAFELKGGLFVGVDREGVEFESNFVLVILQMRLRR